MFKKFFTTINSLNQAIQPRVVGPLFYLRGIALYVPKFIGIGVGTSIDYVNKFCGPWPVRAKARKVILV